MNLLLITKDENKHYVLIKDFNKFCYNQTKHKEKKTLLHVLFTMFFIRKYPKQAQRELYNHKWQTSYKYAQKR